MKAFLRLAGILLLFFISVQEVSATHGSGATITYKQIGNDSFIVMLTVFRDCNGINLGNTRLNVSSGSNSFIENLSLVSFQDVTPVCDTLCSKCDSTNCYFPYGIQKFIYTGLIDLSSYSNSCNWVISSTICCRAGGITTGSAHQNFYIESTLNSCLNEPNSSPEPIINGPQILCVGTCTELNFAMTDADEDSLVYSIVAPRLSASNNVNYSGPYSYDKPLYFFGFPNSNLSFNYPQCRGFHLNPHTGLLQFRPMQAQYASIAIKVEEYRNGVKIGEMINDFAIIVINCAGTNPAPSLSADLPTDTFYACTGDSIRFKVNTNGISGNSTFSTDLFLVNKPAGAAFVVDSAFNQSGTFIWYADSSLPSGYLHHLIFMSTNKDCPLPKKTYTSVYIKTQDNPYAPVVTNSFDTCNGTAEFLVSDTAVSSVNYNWNGSGGLQGSGSSVRHTYPDSGTYSISLQMSSPGNCTRIDTSVFTTPAVNFLKIRNLIDTTVCYNSAIQVGAAVLDGHPPYSYQWSTGDTVLTPLVNVRNDTILQLTVTDGVGCEVFDSLNINIFPRIIPNAGADFFQCLNSSPTQLSGTPANGLWTGNGIDSTGVFNPDTAGLGSFPLIYYHYDSNGCYYADTTVVTVNDMTVSAGNDTIVCNYDATINLGGTPGGGNWSGPYIINSGQSFSITQASPGTYNLIYTVTGGGCTKRDTMALTVLALPFVNAGTDFNICISTDSVKLSGSPNGGTWSGPGMSDSFFFPQVVDTGSYVLTYFYTDSNGCENYNNRRVKVEPLVSAGNDTLICLYSGTFKPDLKPAGGVLSGSGVTDYTFYPDSTGTGTHSVVYKYIQNMMCSQNDTIVITVAPFETVFAGNDTSVCHKSPSFALTGSPAGGTFSGTGVYNQIFYPDSVNPGTYKITYRYSDSTLCEKEDNKFVTIHPLPRVNAGFDVHICEGNGPTLINPTPAGGNWSATFPVLGNSFQTASLSAGSYIAVYNYTDSNTCNSTDTTQIVVDTVLTVDAGLDTVLCANADNFKLQGSPLGGVWVGSGVAGNEMDPAVAGVGNHTLYYTYGSAPNCRKTDSMKITILAAPTANAGADTSMCEYDPAVQLYGSPTGGFWMGTGIDSSGIFHPSVSGAGVFTVYYNTTNSNACKAVDSSVLTVYATPVVDAGKDTLLCYDTVPLPLTGTPTGGNWTGNGVVQNSFNSILAGKGAQKLYYTYIENGCTAIDSFEIKVHKPDIQFSLPTEVCFSDSAVQLFALPLGGIFSGEAIAGDTLFPHLAADSITTVYYSVNDSIGCTTSDSAEIIIKKPAVNAGSDTFYCTNLPPLLLSATPAGGNWSGTGLFNDTFYPDSSGTGMFTLTYQYTSAGGCSGSDSIHVVVNTPPLANFYGSPRSGLFPLQVRLYDSSSANTGNWKWFADSTLISMDKDPILVFNNSGTYDISLAILDTVTGCADTITKAGYITILSGLSKAQEAGIKIYPNPAGAKLLIEFSDNEFIGGTVSIYTAEGKLVKTLLINNKTVPIQREKNIKAGAYMLVLKAQNGKAVYSTIIFK